VIARTLPRIPGLKPAPAKATYRIAVTPASWGVSDIPGWGHQLDAERVLSEAAQIGEGAIEAGPPGFLPDRSVDVKPVLKRHGLRVVAGGADAILHHSDIRSPELAAIDGHASWLAALGAETLVLSAVPPRSSAAAHGICCTRSVPSSTSAPNTGSALPSSLDTAA
jgi:sugar phosphate isomerase/epimerase